VHSNLSLGRNVLKQREKSGYARTQRLLLLPSNITTYLKQI